MTFLTQSFTLNQICILSISITHKSLSLAVAELFLRRVSTHFIDKTSICNLLVKFINDLTEHVEPEVIQQPDQTIIKKKKIIKKVKKGKPMIVHLL